ncbi:MAG: xanthine dehydrogenase molybdopterin binding subunit, partial [Pseudomonadota bacterium]
MPDTARPVSEAPALNHVHKDMRHDSADKHVSGAARYIDDLPEPPGLLHMYIAMSERAHADITMFDLSAVRSAPGVAVVISAEDVPGPNDIGPVVADDPLFAAGNVQYHGQALFAVGAESIAAARAAAKRAKITYAEKPVLVSVADAKAAGSELEAPQKMVLGDAEAAIDAAPNSLSGQLEMGGQDHFYLEGQIALAVPGEDDDLHIYSSTQNPTETQHLVARTLGIADHCVNVEVRRMGGGFGGKETQSTIIASAAALGAAKTGQPVKLRLDRDDDMILTGKRHDFDVEYRVGFDNQGMLHGVQFDFAGRCGFSTDLSMAINDRTMFHADNAYFLNTAEIVSRRMRTNTVSNTAFRGFGGPQGMLAIERIIDEIAFETGRDPLDVRLANVYGEEGRCETPYGQIVEDAVAKEIMEELAVTSHYRARRDAIEAWNATSPVLKRGIALTPVKFGISFTTTHLNQAGALIHLYSDGSVHLNHGGTEMGQGLMIKIAQVVADVFQIDLAKVKVTSTQTDKVPNTSATAASSGTDINGMAARNAALTIKQRLIAFAAERYDCAEADVVFVDGHVTAGTEQLSFAALAKAAYLGRISLSSTGFYKTPKIHYDRATHKGRPFFYYAYGAAVSEVAIDTLTGENRVLRTDILHDVGRSINPAIDLGQIEGGFIQGMGWLTMEELVFDKDGRLRTHAPSTYKIPTASDRPAEMNIEIWAPGENREDTIHRSKAVGEPPFMLAISVFSALT